jgi:hypothetical protein
VGSWNLGKYRNVTVSKLHVILMVLSEEFLEVLIILFIIPFTNAPVNYTLHILLQTLFL